MGGVGRKRGGERRIDRLLRPLGGDQFSSAWHSNRTERSCDTGHEGSSYLDRQDLHEARLQSVIDRVDRWSRCL